MHPTLRFASVLAATLGAAAAQELPSGPPPGTALTAFRAYAPFGVHAGQEFDVAAEIGEAPGVLLFVHEVSRNTAPVIRGLAELQEEFAVLGLRTRMIRVADDRTAAEEQMTRVSRAMQLEEPIVVSLDGADGPGNYALNRKCTLTLVTVKDARVHATLGLTDTGRQDLPRLRQMVEAVAGPLPNDEDRLRALIAQRLPADPEALRARAVALELEVRRLRQQLAQARDGGNARNPRAERMRGERRPAAGAQPERRPDARQREGKAPEDAELQKLLRAFTRKDNSDERVGEVLDAITARVGDDAGLRDQAVEMFRMMLSLDYGNETARAKARAYVDAHRRQP